MVPNKQFFVYLQKKLGANKHLFICKRNWGQRNDFGLAGGGGGGQGGGGQGGGGEKYKNNFFGVYQHKIFSVYKHLIFVVYKHQYYCVYKRSFMGSF